MLTLFWFLHMYIEIFLDCGGDFHSRTQSVPNHCWCEDVLWTLTNFLVSVLCCLALKLNPPSLTGGQLSTYGGLSSVWPQCQHVENSGRLWCPETNSKCSGLRYDLGHKQDKHGTCLMFCWMALQYPADPAFLLGTMSWANFPASSKKTCRFMGG